MESLKPSGLPSIDRVQVRVYPLTTRGPFGFVMVAVIDESPLVSVTTGGSVESVGWALATAGNASGASAAMATTKGLFMGISYHVPSPGLAVPPVSIPPRIRPHWGSGFNMSRGALRHSLPVGGLP